MAKRFFIENITENKQGISPSLSLKLVSYSRKVGTYLLVELPAYIWVGKEFSMTVTAKNIDGTTNKQYKGDCTITENGDGDVAPITIASADWENGVATKALIYTTELAATETTLVITITDNDKPWITGSGRTAFSWQVLEGFDDPYDINYDSVSKFIYIIGPYDYIVKTKIDGSDWEQYGEYGSGVGQFHGAISIQYVSGGFIYVADEWNHRIVKTKMGGAGWETFGTYGSGVGQLKLPQCVWYDVMSGYLYIADTWNSRIVKTKIDGTGWETFGTSGSGVGQFAMPYGIFFDSTTGYIYVSDRNNYRIVKTKIDGTGWTTYGTRGNGVGQFQGLRGIYYDNTKGYIYATDSGLYRIIKTKIDGTGWETYGVAGVGVGQFKIPSGIHYNTVSGFIYVADTNNDRIIRARLI